MALIGNCSFSTFSEHATETVTETVTLTDGTIETSVSPLMVETVTICTTGHHLMFWQEKIQVNFDNFKFKAPNGSS